MASIVQRKNRYCVVYLFDDENGKRKQKWESFRTMADAKRRKAEVEYREELGNLVIPKCQTLDELLKEYVSLYGKATWSISMYQSCTSLIEHYISPLIGAMKLKDVTSRVLEKYYMTLLKTPAVKKVTERSRSKKVNYVTPATVKKVHNILRSCFHQAVKWDLMEKNPALYATVPKAKVKTRAIWDADTLFRAIALCEDTRLKLAINLAFSCSLRIGELLGLTWDCVDISEESITAGRASIYVNKELQRVEKDVMEKLEKKDVLRVFPELRSRNKTVLVLKKPKTATSTRKIFLPKTVSEMLTEWKNQQDEAKEALGSEYSDFDLVMANGLGMPTESSRITDMFNALIAANDLPRVVFHSLRHSSITYKLKLNGGDIKAVQGDSGHAQASMVTDQYSHILDEDRKHNAELLEEAFYSGKAHSEAKQTDNRESRAPAGSAQAEPAAGNSKKAAAGLNAELLAKLLSNPEMTVLLAALAGNLK